MNGHGHVTPNPDGSRARCGGPKFCGVCALEAAQIATATRRPIVDQPPPVATTKRPTWELVIADVQTMFEGALQSPTLHQDPLIKRHMLDTFSHVLDDMQARDAIGRERYGMPLTAGNGRDNLVDAYQEALDFAVYLRNAHEESRDGAISEIYADHLAVIVRLRAVTLRKAKS